jgi:two-component system, NarL family, invasion response regulator UvrY
MPGIDGVETARRLSASHPASTIVLISSASLEDVPAGFGSCGAAEFVRKEDFGPATLRRLWSEHGCRSIGTDPHRPIVP